MHGVGIVLALVVLGTAVATFARRWSVPAPSLLVLAGVAVALVPGVPQVRVAPETIALLVLPPLLYASAEEMSPRELRAVWRPVAVLALGLVLATAAAVAGLGLMLSGLSASMAFVLGAVLASTDPVAVTALARRLPLPARIQTLVQAESLFNDATSLVLFKVAVGIAVSVGGVSWLGAGGQFVLLAGGGAGIGAAVSVLVTMLRSRTADPVLQTVIALVTPYAAYMLAETADTSGVTAVVVAGVAAGGTGYRVTDARIRLQVHSVYAVIVFLLESVVFALIGLELPTLVRDLPPGSDMWPLQAAALAAALIGIRILYVGPTVALARSVDFRTWPLTRVVTWAGTRGVMPLAAALAIPLATDAGAPLAGRPLILVLTTAVVATTLTVQGLTLAAVVRTSGLAVDPERIADKEAAARQKLARAALD
ncbi:MAG: cation:proton antiporter, partial [Catenulispora sp.]